MDLATPFKGPFQTLPLADEEAASAALALARLAGLLPAFFLRGDGSAEVVLQAADVAAMAGAAAMSGPRPRRG